MAWQGFPFCVFRPGVLLCCAVADWASDKVSRRLTSGVVVTLGSGLFGCWAKKQRCVALSSWVSELFSAITACTRTLAIQSGLKDLASVAAETDCVLKSVLSSHARLSLKGHVDFRCLSFVVSLTT